MTKQQVNVRVTRHFDASPERVFDAWLDPEMIGKWMFVEAAPSGTGTGLTLTHELHPGWAEYASRTEAGWTRMLDALAAVLRQ
ncbi:MAG: SRPBCC family protein [Bryobacteraceae bacterium]